MNSIINMISLIIVYLVFYSVYSEIMRYINELRDTVSNLDLKVSGVDVAMQMIAKKTFEKTKKEPEWNGNVNNNYTKQNYADALFMVCRDLAEYDDVNYDEFELVEKYLAWAKYDYR